ncbi:hypothetical protein Ac42p231 [Acinetobacter phage Ac42]|uniref:hypothetical protein n=1 Tax=Acinetobacter phage Ac42 TaxID=762660 RepID=UPI0001EBCE0F|nr:hypothetical protein Ac42p231 [Acinetobacter phage Ac42]ADI96467.1 hypothetical protein Ac42p231 [Acinetobacter phage Ac42]
MRRSKPKWLYKLKSIPDFFSLGLPLSMAAGGLIWTVTGNEADGWAVAASMATILFCMEWADAESEQ